MIVHVVMQNEPRPGRVASPARKPRGEKAFRAVAGGALVLEYIAIAMVFDIKPALDRGGAWAELGALRDVGMVAAAALIALFAIGYRPQSRENRSWAGRQKVGLWLTHLGLLSSFCGLTWFVLSRGPAPPGSPWPWLTLWAVAGLLSTLAFLGAVFGPSFFSRRAFGLAAGATLAGTIAVVAGKALQTQHDWLSRSVVQLSGALLRLGFDNVVADPGTKILGAEGFRVFVADECSGLEGVGLAAVIMPVYLFAFRRQLRFPHALLLLPAVLVAVWLGNTLRIATLVWVGVRYDAELAVGGFHSKIGWTFFCAIVLGITALGGRLSFFSDTATARRPALANNPTAAFLLPLMGLIASAQLTGLFTNDHDPLYWVRIVAAGAIAYTFRHAYRGLGWRPSWAAVAVGVGVAVPWIALGPATEVAGAAPQLGLFWLGMRALGSSTVVPLVEELAFRGFLLRRLQSAEFWKVSLVSWTPVALGLSSLLFGLLHGRWLAGALAGFGYAVLQIRTGRIGDAVVAHGLTNALIAAWVLGADDWSHW